MNVDWLADGRKIPDDVMYYIRAMAVNAIRVLGQSPEAIAKAFNFNRPCIYRWLRQYDEGGFDALKSEMPPGAEPLITGGMDEWLRQTVLDKTPVDFGYDRTLWTCGILSELLKAMFGVTVSESAVRLHLKALMLTYQKPEYQDVQRGHDAPRANLGASGQDPRRQGQHETGRVQHFVDRHGPRRPAVFGQRGEH
jgi:transposase